MADKGTIKVVCRLRPENAKELSGDYKRCVEFEEEEIKVQVKCETRTGIVTAAQQQQESHSFRYDKIYGPDTEQERMFQEVAKPVLDSVFDGYNGTIFAYGQTSSGKTFTMEGVVDDEKYKGIIPRMMDCVFAKIQQAPENMEFLIKCSMLEIYMERIQDLLDPRKNNLQVKGGVIQDCTEQYVSSKKEMQDLMQIGTKNRQVAATGMNDKSSRSHSLFVLSIIKKDKNDDSSKAGRLYLVDLAGSESVQKTGCVGVQFDEAKMINKSLSALGNVIKALTEGSSHIPYRDSKLTRVLEESLGGNSLTVLVITCSMSSFNAAETLSTLRFGSRAKKIKNKPKVNVERSPKKLMMLLDEADEKIKRQAEVIGHLHRRITGVLQDTIYKDLIAELNEIVKKVNSNDVQGLYKLLQNGYVAELNETVKAAPETTGPMVSKEASDKEKTYLREKLSQSSEKLLKLCIELSEAKKQLEALKEEKRELETELKGKNKEINELTDRLRLSEIHNKLQVEEYIRSLTQLELGVENISYVYQQRSRDIEQLCKSLDRILFDEGLANVNFGQATRSIGPQSDTDQVRQLMEEQPKAMLRASINNAIEIVKRIQGEVSEDQTTLKQVIEQLHTLQTIPNAQPRSSNSVTVRHATDPAAPATPTHSSRLEIPERLQTCGSDIVSTGCDEEAKFHQNVDDVAPALRVETEPPMPTETKVEPGGLLDATKMSGFFRIQRKTIEDLNVENQQLRDEIDRLQREMSKSSIEAIKQVQQELTKALEKQKEEYSALQQKLEASNKEIEQLKEGNKQQLSKKEEEIKRILLENKKMKEYTDTLMRTRADIFKVVAMEKMLNDMVTQLSKMTEKCKQQQIELDKKDQEAQKIHEVMQRLEKESKSYAAIAKYLTLKSKLDTKEPETAKSQRGNDLFSGSFTKLARSGKHDTSFREPPIPPLAKIVKPIKGGGPPVKPVTGFHHRTNTGLTNLQLSAIGRADTFREGRTEYGKTSTLENNNGLRLLTPRTEMANAVTVKDKAYVQNLRKFDILLETQKAAKTHSSSESEDSDEDERTNGIKTERKKQIAEKLFG